MQPALCAVLAAAFAIAAVTKHRDSDQFRRYLAPIFGRGSRILAHITVCTEVILAVGCGLATITPEYRAWIGWMSVMFVSAASIVHLGLIARTDAAECRCFGRLTGATDGIDRMWLPAIFTMRNAGLLAAGLVLTQVPSPGILAGVMLLVLLAMAALILSTRRNRALLSAPIHPRVRDLAGTMATLQAHSWWVNGRPRPF